MRGIVRPRLRAALGLVLAGIAACVPAGTASAATPSMSPTQVQTGYSNGAVQEKAVTAKKAAELLSFGGADVDRVQISWKLLEPTRGSFNWGTYDAIYQADLARGVKPLFNLAYAPAWASGGLCAATTATCHAPPTPSHYADFANAAARVAARYPAAVGIEIWNEPNTPYYWGTTPDPAAYLALLKAAHASIKAVQPTMKVVAGATASGSGSVSTGKISGPDFIGALYQAGAKPFMDVISVHSYPATGDTLATSTLAPINAVGVLREWFDDTSKPIWVTESGVSTTGPNAVSESLQATILGAVDTTLRTAPGVEMVLFHELVERNRLTSDPERGFGVVTRTFPFRKKPAYCALAAAWGKTSCR